MLKSFLREKLQRLTHFWKSTFKFAQLISLLKYNRQKWLLRKGQEISEGNYGVFNCPKKLISALASKKVV